MKIFLFSMTIIMVCSLYVHAQRDVITISGQNIRLESDGRWVRLTQPDSLIKELNMIDSPADVMQQPLPDSLHKNNNINDAIRSLLTKAELNEIVSYLTLDNLEKDLALAQVELSHSKQTKNKVDVKLVKTRIKDIKSKIKAANKLYNLSGKTVLQTKELYITKDKGLNKKMEELARKLDVDLSPFIADFKYSENQSSNTIVKQMVKEEKKTSGNCLWSRDETLNKERFVESEPELFFTHTPDKLKSYFKEKELMKVYASVIQNGKTRFLRLQIKIISKDAARNYGQIQNGNMMRINFISGKVVSLYNSNDTAGKLEQYTGYMVFDAVYPLNGDESDILGKVMIDKIGIMWSSGYEMYDIYNVDVIARHISCLKSL